MKATMVPRMVPVGHVCERNTTPSFRRSWSSMLYGEAPPPESEASVRRRMADLIVRLVSATGAITRDDLERNFSADQITAHFRPALKAAGVHRLAGVL